MVVVGCATTVTAPLPASSAAAKAEADPAALAEFTQLVTQKGDLAAARAYLGSHARELPPAAVSQVLTRYLALLEGDAGSLAATLEQLQAKDPPGESVFTQGGVTLAQLNDVAYLKQESPLSRHPDLKALLLKARARGLKLIAPEGMFSFQVDYPAILNEFPAHLTPELAAYLKIQAREADAPALEDAALLIGWDELAARLAALREGLQATVFQGHCRITK